MPILDVVRHYVGRISEESGGVYKARCPFHDDTNASLAIYTKTNTFYCFGCGAGKGHSDTIAFVRRAEGCDFRSAVEIISERHGVPLVKDAKMELREKRLLGLQRTNDAFVEALQQHAQAREYLARRLPDRDLWKRWGIGFIPADHPYYRSVAGRLSFPIRNLSGRIVGWEFRAIDGSEPKTRCSKSSDLFNKRASLPGIHRVPYQAPRIVLVEGFIDMLKLEIAGVRDACCLIGSRLYPEQIELIQKRLAPEGYVVLLLDGDPAGRKGTAAATSLLEETGIDSRVIRLPDGVDPDEWAGAFKSTLELEEALEQARPLIHLQMLHAQDRYLAGLKELRKEYQDRSMEMGRRFARELRSVLAAHPRSPDLAYYQGWLKSLLDDPARIPAEANGQVEPTSQLEAQEVRSAG